MKNFLLLAVIFSLLISCVNHDINSAFDCDRSDLSLTLITVDSATTCGTADGNILVDVTGGKPPYSFFLNDVTPYPENQFNNLPPGSYTILVRDANKCTDTLTNVMVMAKDVVYEATIESDTECLTNNGSVTVNVTDGNPPYTFKIATGVFSTENFFSNLSHGSHFIYVKDNSDCVIALNITIPRGQTGVRWTLDIKPLLEATCATKGCHNGTDRMNDFRDYDDVKYYASKIKSKTQDRSMPFDGSLTQAQIDLIACWVDDGALKN